MQQERDKKYRAHKRKLQKQRRKTQIKEPLPRARPPSSGATPAHIDEVDFEEYVHSHSVDPAFLAAFKRFNPSEEDVDQISSQTKVPEAVNEPVELSNKKLKRLLRPTVYELKRMTRRPDVVEWVDTTAQDPEFLVYLKSYKNTVPVPKHWSQKRKFMNLKQGSDRMPFTLPYFIEATGIAKIRAQMREREAGKLLKQRMRERMNPKLGKLDIDYQLLPDAFFKYQSKPR
jgi:splicing factor 3B subunit 2